MYYTYVVKCNDGTYYTGITNDLEKRIQAHNGLLPGGAKYTRGRRPVELIWFFPCENKSLALQLERKLKGMSRTQKLQYMSENGIYKKSNN